MTTDRWGRVLVLLAGLSGAAAVAAGAYTAHGWQGSPQALEWLDKASRYQMYHALALLAAALLAAGGGRLARLAGAFFAAGTLLFCGSLYGMALFNLPLVPLVPVGGTCFILGWLAIAASALVGGRRPGI